MTDVLPQTDTFSFVGGALCLDFTNTVGGYDPEPRNNRLNSYEDLLAWSRDAGIIEAEIMERLLTEAGRRPEEADAVLARALALRLAIHRIFEAVAFESPAGDADVATLNAHLSDAMPYLRVVPTKDAFDWAWADGEDKLEQVLWPVVRSAAELLTSEARDRVRECAGDTCGWLFLDMSRNHSRHWCDMKDCGNRAKARRYYHKKRDT